MTTCGRAAAAYAEHGLSVIPWRYTDGAKRPSVRWREMQERRWSAGECRRWWMSHPDDNVGVVTGAISDLVVVDCDDDAALGWAVEHLPPTPWVVRTGRGAQLGYRHPGGTISNRTRVGTMALDLRGDGGYVAMPPSVHRTGAIYRWGASGDHTSARPVFAASWLPQPERAAVTFRVPAWSGTDRAARSAEAWMRRREPAILGAGGHDHTRATAWALAQMGLTWDQAWPLLERWNATCQPPWQEAELAQMLLSALRKS